LLCFDIVHTTRRLHPSFAGSGGDRQKMVESYESKRRVATVGDNRRNKSVSILPMEWRELTNENMPIAA
jgi:hypothetical protein